ncbi:bis(5'-nucleosyl)-tetraphosphatase [asymmetrical] [Aplysia californica]|uniref:Bis(5'-nucleosyl)-tetraphosphatase [asymmetrical] n=1 Tax=Aplysia californica TaxID=6500 RepID=A0ABM0JIZ6_APLCA|nr:bis(5'-nucleosyl)-tetraphosphatase [asymmetrical] [Aplysia californica]
MAASNQTKLVVAAGFLIFRRLQNQVQYLLLQTSYGGHHWTPPKGHVDPGESEFETAVRETEEEAGLKAEQMKIIKEFEKSLHYDVKGKPKKVVYWLSELSNPNDPIVLSHEHKDFKWLELESACTYSEFPDMISLLKEADTFITSKYSS